MSSIVNLNGVKNSFSLPLQIITAALLLMQVFSFIIILYLCGGFPFHLATFTSTIGFVMLGIALFFAAWNIIALIQRKRQINKASTTEEKENIFKASTLVRFVTMNMLSIVALLFALIWKDFYFLIFFVCESFHYLDKAFAISYWLSDITFFIARASSISRSTKSPCL